MALFSAQQQNVSLAYSVRYTKPILVMFRKRYVWNNSIIKVDWVNLNESEDSCS